MPELLKLLLFQKYRYFLSLYNIKNINFFEQDDESYLLIDYCFLKSSWYNNEDSYNYYNNDVNNRLRYKESDNEYVIRYIDKYRSVIAPLQIKIKIKTYVIYIN